MSDQVVSRRGALFGALLLGAGVAVALGVFGRVHEPTYGATAGVRVLQHRDLQGLDRRPWSSRWRSCSW